ncbi:hypothetical protein AX14_009327 [Amanita brunnescens Koide BX004]|nr:hypothetical protein AX14_009327 [Amanita brunnescens Koide BX004]
MTIGDEGSIIGKVDGCTFGNDRMSMCLYMFTVFTRPIQRRAVYHASRCLSKMAPPRLLPPLSSSINKTDAGQTRMSDQASLSTTKLDGPQTYSFTTMSYEHLDELNIFYAGELRLKTDSILRAKKTNSIGEDQDWSADRLYHHLSFLEGCLLRNPRLNKLAAQAFCVTEAKGPDQRLESHIPQALAELYACAKHQEKRIIRGALTNGHEWIFFILKLDEGGNGGKYSQSTVIKLMQRGESEVSHEGSSLIAAIIADWIQHSHDEIGHDDFFMML